MADNLMSIIRQVVLAFIVLALVFVIWIMFTSEASAKDKTTEIQSNQIQVLNTPNLELKTVCADNGGIDLNKCKRYEYFLSIDNLEIKYHKKLGNDIRKVFLAMTINVKDWHKPVFFSYSGNENQKQVNEIEFGDESILITDINPGSIESNIAPILNFPDKDNDGEVYTGPLRNQQSIRIGEYSILPATWDLGYARATQDLVETGAELLRVCKAKFIVNCGTSESPLGEAFITQVDNGKSWSKSMCNGNVEIAVGNPTQPTTSPHMRKLQANEFNQKFENCYGYQFTRSGDEYFITPPTAYTLGSDCDKGKICCVQIKVRNGEKKLENFGEKIQIRFWNIFDENENGHLDLEEQEKFIKNCADNNWRQNNYCDERKLSSHFYFAKLEESTTLTIPMGC